MSVYHQLLFKQLENNMYLLIYLLDIYLIFTTRNRGYAHIQKVDMLKSQQVLLFFC